MDDRTIGRLIAEAADSHPDRPFLAWEDERWSYGDLESITNRYANAFAGLGVGKGDRVAILMRNRPEYYWVLWGLGKIGAIPVTINTSAKKDLLAYFIAQSRSGTLVLAAEFDAAIAELLAQLPDLERVLLADAESSPTLAGGAVDLLPLTELERGDDSRPPLDAVAGDDPAAIFYTSGTTGPSKGVLTPHSQPRALAREMVAYFELDADDVLFTCLPMFHVNAVWYTGYSAIEAGGSVALVDRFSASRFWQQIDKFGATQFNFMGSMANILKTLEPSEEERRNQVRTSLIGPATADVIELFRDRYGIGVVTGYGSTEMYLMTRFRPWEVPEKIGTAGAVSPGGQVRVLDEEGNEVGPGVAGELTIKPDDPGWMMNGYFEMPEATGRAIVDGWFHSGDRGFLDEDGYLHFVDRIKDSIRRRGENVSAFELETQVNKHPGVQEVAAIPVPAELGEDDIMVWLVPNPGTDLDPAEVIAFCEERVGRYMLPRFVEIVDELPKTPTSRIEKYKLREWAAERRPDLWDREKETAAGRQARAPRGGHR
ncbi:MAG: AMP-binding protein [Actinobacteria bacterium]|nr:AMP-binding protein [Actinomycetota bacterium]